MLALSDSDPRGITRTITDRPSPAYLRAKRLLDVTFSLAGLIFLLPVIVVLMVALLVADGRPLFFRHKRIGQNGREFNCLKFRTMRRDADKVLADLLANCPQSRAQWSAQQKLTNDPRIHRIGRFMRLTSLDELPQLINILRGEMSLVGPRPIVPEELGRYGEYLSFYLAMTPGLTGSWQVYRKPNTSYDDRIGFDVSYYKSRSLGVDLWLIFETCRIVLFARNIG